MATRRAHTKTRAGCQECKRRKVKCDERRPSCFNCTRYDTPCSFLFPALSACPTCGQTKKRLKPHANSERSDSHTSPCGTNHGTDKLIPYLDRGDQDAPQDQMEAIYDEINNTNNIGSLPTTDQPLDITLLDLRNHDFELMHHWCTSTSSTMGLQDELLSVWKNAIPQQGYHHPFVKHGLMALSALHKAYLLQNMAEKYLTLSAYHYTRGQAEFRKGLLAVTDDNCKPMFCFSVILIIYMCSATVTRSPRHVIENPIQKTLELFSVCRGLRAVTEPYYDRALKSDLWPLARTSWLVGDDKNIQTSTPSLQASPLPADTFEAIDSLREYLRSEVGLIHQQEAEEAVSSLRMIAVNVAMAGINVELGCVVPWPHNISDTFMSDIRQLRPHALLILAYFTPLLSLVDRNFWFLRNWSTYLLADIQYQLRDASETALYLEWPKMHVFK